MKDLATTIIAAAKNQRESTSPYLWLISVKVPTDPPTRIRITNYTDQVQRGTSTAGDPLTYYPFPVAIGDFRSTNSGDLPTSTINIASVSREMMATLQSYDGLIGQEIVIRWVLASAIGDPTAELKFVGEITGCTIDDQVASFTYGSRNLQKAQFPTNRYVANHCRWRFGTAQCGYVIPATPGNTVGTGFDFCPRTIEACEERGEDEEARSLTSQHPLRYGGFPGIQRGNQ